MTGWRRIEVTNAVRSHGVQCQRADFNVTVRKHWFNVTVRKHWFNVTVRKHWFNVTVRKHQEQHHCA